MVEYLYTIRYRKAKDDPWLAKTFALRGDVEEWVKENRRMIWYIEKVVVK